MAFQSFNVKFTGFTPLLLNNPQTVDSFNKYSIAKKKYTSKRSKTEEDVLALRELEIESKLYFDDELKVYVPTAWVIAMIAKNAWAIAKVKKETIRGGVFVQKEKAKLSYDSDNLVKKLSDISGNEKFTRTLILPQQQVRLAKSFPIFHNWSFSVELEFDNKIVDESSLKQILEHRALYGGFGDFRPTYGRCKVEFSNE